MTSVLRELIESEKEKVACLDGTTLIPSFFLKHTDYYKSLKSGRWAESEVKVCFCISELQSFEKVMEHLFYSPRILLDHVNDCSWLKVADFLGLSMEVLYSIIDCFFSENTFNINFIFSFVLEEFDGVIKSYILEKLYRNKYFITTLINKIFSEGKEETVIKVGNKDFLIAGYLGCYITAPKLSTRHPNYQKFLDENASGMLYSDIKEWKDYVSDNDFRQGSSKIFIFTHFHQNLNEITYSDLYLDSERVKIARKTILEPFLDTISIHHYDCVDYECRFFDGVKEIFPSKKSNNSISKRYIDDYTFAEKVAVIKIECSWNGDDY